MKLEPFEFRNRFTPAEKVRIYQAAESNISIRVWLDDLYFVQAVDTAHPETVAAVVAIEAAGLLDPGRSSSDILSSPPTSGELGGFSAGDVVRVLQPFDTAFPGEYIVESVEAESLLVAGSSFSPSYLEHV